MLVETVVEIDDEITLLTVRTVASRSCTSASPSAPAGGRVDGEMVPESWQPQQMTQAALDAAKSIAARIVNALGGRGVFGVELLVRATRCISPISARVRDDSGLVTLRSQRLSEFELHARAILGLPVDTIMISPGAAEVVYGSPDGGQSKNLTRHLAEALRVPETDVRMYGARTRQTGTRSVHRHRLGLALATAPDVAHRSRPGAGIQCVARGLAAVSGPDGDSANRPRCRSWPPW